MVPSGEGAMTDIRRIVLTEEASGAIRWLPADEGARITRALYKLQRFGWTDALKIRLVAHLSGHIHEVRVPGRGRAYRLTCFTVPEGESSTVVIVDCIPKSRWKPRQLTTYLARAERVRATWV